MATPNQIGPMRTPISIEAMTPTDDGYGGSTEAWAEILAPWCDAKYKTVAGSVGAGGVVQDRTQVNFTIRSLGAGSIAQGNRIIWDGRTFYIQATFNADTRSRFLTLVGVERTIPGER